MYQPADGDLLPSYFYAMLDDADHFSQILGGDQSMHPRLARGVEG